MLQKLLKSRTVWTVFFMFVIGGVGAVDQVIPGSMKPFVQGLLGIAAVYFRVDTKVDFKS